MKLADFGLSKWLQETPILMNCAGTPGYIGAEKLRLQSFLRRVIAHAYGYPLCLVLAPEILEAYYHKIPYGKTVDLWSTGVILYILYVVNCADVSCFLSSHSATNKVSLDFLRSGRRIRTRCLRRFVWATMCFRTTCACSRQCAISSFSQPRC